MYVYFNKEGRITTKIPHGEIVRQGNPLNLYICLADGLFPDSDYISKWSASVKFIYPDKTVSTEFPYSIEDGPLRKRFKKLSDSEITFDLISGKSYYTFVFNIAAQYSTNIPGDVTAIIKLYNRDNNTEFYQDNLNFFVENTIGGNKFSSNISHNQHNILTNKINSLNSYIAEISEKIDIFSTSILPPIITDDMSKNFNLGKIYVLNGDFIEVDEIPPINEVISTIAYKINGKYYKLIKPESDDGDVEKEEITDFLDTVGYVYKATENGWFVLNRDIREITGSSEKITTPNIVYGNDSDGKAKQISYTPEPTPETIVRRDKNGGIQVGPPENENSAINKKYVDNNFVNKKEKGRPGGVAELDSDGKVPKKQLPEFDNNLIIRKESKFEFPNIGKDNMLYLDKSTGIIYTWEKSSYKPLNDISVINSQIEVIDGGNANG